ncbi:7TM diverse intracellular signaling domain-containing protein [Mucilaginibacter sp. PAMB04168]|uniref:7TM diverse intracellular signaling domain-containing protein n=1 Tax=Mucilaginibacter sp. PAMB04168 TaxID=3138567 RepID=UPI0031F6B74B
MIKLLPLNIGNGPYLALKNIALTMLLALLTTSLFAQKVLNVDSTIRQHKFTLNEVDYLEDASDKLTFADVIKTDLASRFKANSLYYPNNKNRSSTYWYRVKVRFDRSAADKASLFEFFDQTTDEVTAYIPDAQGLYSMSKAGAKIDFDSRLYQHKNFEFLIKNPSAGEYTYYFKLKSRNLVNVIIVYRTLDYFIHYALNEYLTFGLFYGMVLIFCFHNLLMFMAVKRRQYLYYVFYVLSVGLYEMCVDGIAFQYLWPNTPAVNDFAYGTALYLLSMFALIFTKELLQVKHRARRLYKLINYALVLRTAFFLVCLFVDKSLFIYKFVEFIPLSIAFITGIRIYRNGFKPARFFVLAYAFLFTGFVIKAVSALGYSWLMPSVVGYYSLSFCFVIEMVLLSFAIGDQVRILRKEKDAAQDETIKQMHINSELKDSINQELERQVKVRTREVVEKSKEILEQSKVIEEQNEQLISINHLLEQQASEITRMNVLLEKDNIQLKTNIDKVTDARVLSAELNFEEFSAKYPDQETCYKFLSELKWKNGYQCTRCSHTSYCAGRVPYSRRCTKCSYEESALHNTIFQNNRIPINKAFYLVYLIYSSKGTISSHQLSDKLGIRQSTCWAYAIRIKKAMQEQKRSRKKDAPQGWSTLVL